MGINRGSKRRAGSKTACGSLEAGERPRGAIGLWRSDLFTVFIFTRTWAGNLIFCRNVLTSLIYFLHDFLGLQISNSRIFGLYCWSPNSSSNLLNTKGDKFAKVNKIKLPNSEPTLNFKNGTGIAKSLAPKGMRSKKHFLIRSGTAPVRHKPKHSASAPYLDTDSTGKHRHPYVTDGLFLQNILFIFQFISIFYIIL